MDGSHIDIASDLLVPEELAPPELRERAQQEEARQKRREEVAKKSQEKKVTRKGKDAAKDDGLRGWCSVCFEEVKLENHKAQ